MYDKLISIDAFILLTVTLDELQIIADNMRPYTADAMKIEVAPWIRDYVVDMDELYTELSLEKLHNKPTRQEVETLMHYRELFKRNKHIEIAANSSPDLTEQDSSPAKRSRIKRHSSSSDLPLDLSLCKEGEKILMKADPGMGKTTQCKKISWDWAMRLFTYFHIVFFVFLKLVKPGDIIENVIIKQNPYIKGLEITEQKIRDILRLLGNRCLLILDGLDEHAIGTNKDVLSIIRGEKYLKCNIIVTSRPHISKQFERYFPTVVRVDGFTRNKAEQFASKILNDQKVIKAVLNYNPAAEEDIKEDDVSKVEGDRGDRGKRKYVPIHKCPILLSFMCLLAREDHIDISNTKMHTGEIYTRMVRCLYKKYVIRKGLSFDSDQFKAAVTKIGKLALKTLLSGDPLLKRSEVIKEVGPDAFDYGILIGHEDAHVLIKDETADIFVTFPHRSIQEFLGALYFIWMLDKGETAQSLVGCKSDKPIFLTNALFLQFCLFLCDDQKFFNFENRHKVYQYLIQFTVNLTNCPVLNMTTYPALHISSSDLTRDKLRVGFITDILVQCNKTSKLILPAGGDILDSILGKITPILKKITRIDIAETKTQFRITFLNFTEIIIDAYCIPEDLYVDTILKHYTQLNNGSIVYLYLGELKYSTSKLSYLNVKSLCMVEPRFGNIIEIGPQLTLLCLSEAQINNKLSEALQTNNRLSHLSLVQCKDLMGKLPVLFQSEWPHLKYLNLRWTEILESDLQFRCLTCNGPKKTLPNLTSLGLCISENDILPDTFSEKFFVLAWQNLNSLHLYGDFESYSCVNALKENKLPSVTYLRVKSNFCRSEMTGKEALSFNKFTHLNCLNLNFCYIDGPLEIASSLSELNLFHCSGFEGNLSSLISDIFPQLTTLILSHCFLNSNDFASLAQAKVKGYLPLLKHLDISYIDSNMLGSLKYLFDGPCRELWRELLTLDIRTSDGDIEYEVIDYMNEIVDRGILPSLRKLGIYLFENRNTHWNNLEKLMLIQCEDNALRNISDAVRAGCLPNLRTLCIEEFEGYDADIVHSLSQLDVSCHQSFSPSFKLYRDSENCMCESYFHNY